MFVLTHVCFTWVIRPEAGGILGVAILLAPPQPRREPGGNAATGLVEERTYRRQGSKWPLNINNGLRSKLASATYPSSIT